MPALDADALNTFLQDTFVGCRTVVTAAADDVVELRRPVDERDLRPGGTVSGPTMMELADTAIYVAILARIGLEPMVVTTDLNFHFLRKPAAGLPLLAHCRLLKCGRQLAIGEVHLFSEGRSEAIAHAVGSYAIPPASGAS